MTTKGTSMTPFRVMDILPCKADTKKILTQDEGQDGDIHIGVAFVTCVFFQSTERWYFCSRCPGLADCLHIGAVREMTI